MRLLLLLLLAPSVAVAQPPDSPFLAAARKREEATRSAEFVVTVKSTFPRGGLSEEVKPPAVVPAEDTVLETTTRTVYDGPRGRYEGEGMEPHISLPRRKMTIVQSSHEFRALTDFAPEPPHKYVANIRPPEVAGGKCVIPVPEPISFACCFSQTSAGTKGAPPTGTTIDIEGAMCEGFRLGSKSTVWADPKQEYAIRRIESELRPGLNKERLNVVIDIQNDRHPVVGWWPRAWTETRRHPSGRVAYTRTGTATLSHVGGPFPDDLFELKFPPGTAVADMREEDSRYVVWPDGEGPPRVEGRRWAGQQWAGVGFAVALLGAAVVWLLRARRKRPVPAAPPA